MNTSYWRWRLRKVRKRAIRRVCRRFYRDTNRDASKSIFVAGTGRSGTTWLVESIASQLPCRIMFEPFYPQQIADYSNFNYFQYMRPGKCDEALYGYCQRILTGAIKDPWIDRQVEVLFPEYRIIKAVRANLFLRWLLDQFPQVPILLMLRHPCAVVLSRLRLAWATDGDIEPFLAQPELVDDFLADKLDHIRAVETPEEKHAVIWCISNLVPLRQFDSESLPIIFYEHLCMQPQVEIPKIFNALQQEYRQTVYNEIKRPSTTSRPTSAIIQSRDAVTQWQQQLSTTQIDRILTVVAEFGLDYLYSDDGLPREQIDARCRNDDHG